MVPISDQEIRLFHKLDREVLCCLLLKLGLDPCQCLLIMTLWLWLENVGYPNLIPQIPSLPYPLLNAIANEAQSCLLCLSEESPQIPKNGGLPLSASLLRKHISLHLFHLRRFTAIAGIKSVLNNLSIRIFSDILQSVLGPSPGPGLVVPGFPHPLFGGLTWTRRPSDEDRTMFLTFSRGFRVTCEEVIELFNGKFGESSVESINMGETDTLGNDQPLFATMVVDGVHTVDRILMGKRIAKFKINGKHIWARKYENRD